MSEMSSAKAKRVVDKRFEQVSLDHPINAMLYNLALRKEEAQAESQSFVEDMHVPIPNALELLEMRKTVSLLPLDTIKNRMKLPSVPGIVFRLQEALEEGASSELMAEIIRPDPKLTAAVLSLANSPLYSLPVMVETLGRAITVIGTSEISSLALGSRLLAMFDDAPPEGWSLQPFWKHSITCAVFAHDLAMLQGRPQPDKYLVAGLLHDLGQVMLISCYPELGKVVHALQQERGMSVCEAETEVFEVDHCMVGGLFFAEWNLPKGIVQAALYHHDPSKCLGKEVAEIVYVANQLATALGFDSQSSYLMDPGEKIWEQMNIDEAGLHDMLEHVDKRLWALFHSLFPS